MLLDICGTGGSGRPGRNVSTAAAFVVSGCGIPVAKHCGGARTRPVGSLDVLRILRVPTYEHYMEANAVLARTGLVFIQSNYHTTETDLPPSAYKAALGNFMNPTHHLLGVARKEWIGSLSTAILGGSKDRKVTFVHNPVTGDELSFGPARNFVVDPDGKERAPSPYTYDVANGVMNADHATPEYNAAELLAVLNGFGEGHYRDVVVATAAEAIHLCGVWWESSLDMAKESLKSGRALRMLERSREQWG